jgi:hypothetical protein
MSAAASIASLRSLPREIVHLRTENTTGWVVVTDGVSTDHRATDVLETSHVGK